MDEIRRGVAQLSTHVPGPAAATLRAHFGNVSYDFEISPVVPGTPQPQSSDYPAMSTRHILRPFGVILRRREKSNDL